MTDRGTHHWGFRAVARGVGVACVAAAFAGCSSPTTTVSPPLPEAEAVSSPSPSPIAPSTAAPSPVVTTSTPTIAVDDAPVSMDGRHVESVCFDFSTSPRAPYVLSPYASACYVDIGIEGGDALTQIHVHALTGATDRESIIAAIEKTGATDVEATTISVDGREAVQVTSDDEWGLRTSYVIVPLAKGRFTQAGAPLTAVSVSSYTYNSDLEALFDAVVRSLDLHE